MPRRHAALISLQRVANGLNANQAVPKDERIDPILDLGARRSRLPFQQQDVVLVDLRRQLPLGTGTSEVSFSNALRTPSLPRSTRSGVMKIASSA
jgi:hypothetical protein